jgi:Domain of unknown function (DUF1707)
VPKPLDRPTRDAALWLALDVDQPRASPSGCCVICRVARLWHDRHVDPGELRASDADREQVAERLRIALDEGRLNLYEYDDRLRDAFSAKTYTELNALLADLPGVTPGAQAQVVPFQRDSGAPEIWRPDAAGRYPGATRRWLAARWESWGGAVTICTAIWGVSSFFAGHMTYFWPGLVAGPWGLVLLVGTVSGLLGNEPQRWAARRARRQAEREVRRSAGRERDDRVT